MVHIIYRSIPPHDLDISCQMDRYIPDLHWHDLHVVQTTDPQFDDLDISGHISIFLICMIELMMPGGSHIACMI